MRFLVLQHLDIEPPALIADDLSKAGHMLETIRTDKKQEVPDTLTDYAGLIVMGGSMSANDAHLAFIDREIHLLQQAIAQNFPVLGICLGAQLLAKAADAEILPSPERELGWYPLYSTSAGKIDPLFSSLPETGLNVFQWHGETFSLPDQAKRLAACPHVPNQAFRLGSCQYGLQFHVEVDTTIIHEWVETGKNEREHLGGAGIRKIITETPQYIVGMASFCHAMCESWLALIEEQERRKQHL